MLQDQQLRAAFTLSLRQAARAWRREADETLAQYGLSEATAWPLVRIARLGEGIRQGALAEALGIEGPSLVRLLDHLCEAGLVRRAEDPQDRRAKTLDLTDQGRAMVERIEQALAERRAQVLRGVSAAELECCLRVFGVLQQATDRPAPLPGDKA